MGKYCLMMPQQKRQRERPKNYLQPFMIILVFAAIVECGIYQKAYLENKQNTSCCVAELNDMPESAGYRLNEIDEAPKFHEQTFDSLKAIPEIGKRLENSASFR
jgi:hypothetical protein